MGIPARPRFVKQLDGSHFAGFNCTCATAAMAVDRATLGTKRTTGAAIRTFTGDTSGGTMLSQVASVAHDHFGVELELHVPGPIPLLWAGLEEGRGVLAQGSEMATHNTPYEASETFVGNHCTWWNEGRGWSSHKPLGGVYVYDPLADNRRPVLAQSPFWLPYAIAEKFLVNLQPWGEDDPRRIKDTKPGYAYFALTRDTEPHVHLRSFNGTRATALSPLPATLHAYNANSARQVNARSGPGTTYPIVAKLDVGHAFAAYQKINGQLLAGSRIWFGSHGGNWWIHSSGVK